MNNVLIVSHYHRSLGFFEDTMKMLWGHGFNNVVIQQTSDINLSKYNGPCKTLISLGQSTYDRSMIELKKVIKNEICDYILLLDNDCFLSNINHLKQYLNEFIRDNYDFSCHLVSPDYYLTHPVGGVIHQIINQKFVPCSDYPGFIPDPHWENSYLLIKKSSYDKLSEEDVSHGRKFIAALLREKMKIGAHYANHRMTYTHFGDEWFHIGNLMQYIFALEQNNIYFFKKDSDIDKSRLGFIQHHNTKYPNLANDNINKNLKLAIDYVGGQTEVDISYGKLIKNTIMEDYLKA